MILEKETFAKLGRTSEQATSHQKITCKCDFCGKIFERTKTNLLRSRKQTAIDACNTKVCTSKKRCKTNELLFGKKNPFQNDNIKKKIKEKNLQRFGVENPSQNPQIKQKQKETCQERYGTENVFANEIIKNKIKNSHLTKYGVQNVMQHKAIRDRQHKTLIEKYGVAHALQNATFRKKAMDTCISNFGYFPVNNYGKKQNEIKDWLNSMGFKFEATRSLIPGKEIDLYDAGKALAIEYCGLYWHNELSPEPRRANYHHQKYKECLSQQIQLLTIFSDEWLNRENQCKSHIKSILGSSANRIFARNCQIKEISKKDGCDFVEMYHIQGKNKLGMVYFGMFSNNEICGVMSLGRHHRQNNNFAVLDRLCFKDDYQIVGGASKLFSRCTKWAMGKKYDKIVSFSDNRWSLGKVYTALDFKLDCEYGPDYSYVNSKKPEIRISKQSQKKKDTNCPDNLTEKQWAEQRGLARIWDCGKKRWIYKL